MGKIGHTPFTIYIYSQTCDIGSPLGDQKAVLNHRWSLITGAGLLIDNDSRWWFACINILHNTKNYWRIECSSFYAWVTFILFKCTGPCDDICMTSMCRRKLS